MFLWLEMAKAVDKTREEKNHQQIIPTKPQIQDQIQSENQEQKSRIKLEAVAIAN